MELASIEDLVGLILTFKKNLLSPKKVKGVVWCSTREDGGKPKSPRLEEEDLVFITRKFKKYFKASNVESSRSQIKPSKSNTPKEGMEKGGRISRQEVERKRKGFQCLCQGFGHMAMECLNQKKRDPPDDNRGTMKAKWSDNVSESTSSHYSSS